MYVHSNIIKFSILKKLLDKIFSKRKLSKEVSDETRSVQHGISGQRFKEGS